MKLPRVILAAGHNQSSLIPWRTRDPGAVLYGSDGKEVTNEHWEIQKVLQPAFYSIREILHSKKAVEKYGVTSCELLPFYWNLKDRMDYLRKIEEEYIYVEFHLNAHASSASGIEIFYDEGDVLAEFEARNMCTRGASILGIRNRGAKPDTKSVHGGLAVCRTAKRGMLVELGFLTNPKDLKSVRENGEAAIVEMVNYAIFNVI